MVYTALSGPVGSNIQPYPGADILSTSLFSPAPFRLLVFMVLLCSPAACTATVPPPPSQACTDGNTVLRHGFYAYFKPVSASADSNPEAIGFHRHLGYEADLLTALEAMEGAGLSFVRRGIAVWDGIWLQAAAPEYDIVSGGITILDSRTRNAAGDEVVAFTAGHIAFRQSLLVRVEDAERLARHDMLTSDVRVGALAGTTGEARLLQLTGITDAGGILVPGTEVETPQGTAVADGSADYIITSAGASPHLAGRILLRPADDTMPQIVYLGAEAGEAELLAALQTGAIDAVARGEIGNRDAVHAFGNGYTVAALDPEVEYGGFVLPASNGTLISCLNEKIDWLTAERTIGYREWRTEPSVFLQRARQWNAQR